MKKKNEMKKSKKIVIMGLVIATLLIFTGTYAYSSYLGEIQTVKMTENEAELKIQPQVSSKADDIINIALIGIDNPADDYDGSRADSIMIASLDTTHQKIKITSIMRDTFVNIPGEKYDKINHSYAYGGPELTVQTINQNFDMNIKDYITVNFSAMEKIVDAVDGVDIDVKSYEVYGINDETDDKISDPGMQTLNGEQAVAYSAIRYEGDGDYERTERQRTVLKNILEKVMSDKSLPQVLALIQTLGPYIQTSFDQGQMVNLATSAFTSKLENSENARLPLDGEAIGGLWDGVYYLKTDTLSENVIYLHEFIYEEPGYVPSLTVEEISSTITSLTQ